MTERRVVVTGMGCVTPLGNDLPTFWANLIAGKNGITHCLIPENAEIIIDIKNKKYDIKQITKEGSLKREINMLGYNNINYFKKYIQ